MFDREGFINDFIQSLADEDLEKRAEVLDRLSEDDDNAFRIELIEEIIEKIADQDYPEVIEDLVRQVQILKLVSAIEEQAQDSTPEDAKDNAEVEDATKDVAADSGADEAVATAESGGYDSATEEQESKSESN